jgi:putative membrane protein
MRIIPRNEHDRFAMLMLAAFAIIWGLLAIQPTDRPAWLLENVLVFVTIPLLLALHPKLPLSKISYSLIFVFLCLHEVGAHYTYAEVPYDQWFESFSGTGLNQWFGWVRNHYDRIIHFLYGLLITYPVREIVLRVSRARGFWTYLFPLLIVISTSTIYELLEWSAAVVFGGDLGLTFISRQGDVWDAQKDMAFAAVGTVVATTLIASVNRILDRDFAREWDESLRVKHPELLGEVEIARLLAEIRKEEDEP